MNRTEEELENFRQNICNNCHHHSVGCDEGELCIGEDADYIVDRFFSEKKPLEVEK